MGCSECHSHKFDPFTHKDFYSFAAFFADLSEKPIGRRKPTALPAEADRHLFEAVRSEVERIADELKEETPDEAWEEAIRKTPVCWTTLEPVSVSSERGTRVLIQGNDFSLIATTQNGPKPPSDTYTVRFTTAVRDITAFRLEAVPFEELPKGGPGRDPEGGFVISEIEIRDEGNSRDSLPLGGRSLGPGRGGRRDPSPPPRDGFARGNETGDDVHRGASSECRRRPDSGTVPRFRHRQHRARLPRPRPRSLARPQGDRRDSARPSARLCSKRSSRGSIERRRPGSRRCERACARRSCGETRSSREFPSPTSRRLGSPIRSAILPRGNWLDDTGPVVEPAVPHFLPQIETGGRRATRLDLARWIVSSENPLTARVFVNRLWKLFFGQGLSRTLEDLGTQGEWPTHPELLDGLAVEFVESGWDVKHVVRNIVTSAAYRRSSIASRELLDRDPYNRYYARQSRIRLEAEMVRDDALAVSGLLSLEMGGPSVFPHQPPGYWSFLNFPPREWEDSVGEDQNRRGLYTWWQRSFPQPSLLAFDAGSREECVAERTRSNVPQQALVLLNDPTYVEAARAFARRIQEEGGESFDARIDWALRRALSRPPSGDEVPILRSLYEKHQDWTPVARTILNLPELITRP